MGYNIEGFDEDVQKRIRDAMSGKPPVVIDSTEKAAPVVAKAAKQDPRKMNKLEAAYAARLQMEKAQGRVLYWSYESVKLRLADKTWYTPDFFVIVADGTAEVHETKGFWHDDARVKIKVAADLFPFRFIAIQKIKGQWSFEYFKCRGGI